jgi:predicted O-methyltransferase YrrM
MAVTHPEWPPNMNTYTEPLATIASQLKPAQVLEIGIGEYAFSAHMWLEHCDCHLTTIDKNDVGGNAEKLAEEYGSRFTYIGLRSEEVMPKMIKEGKQFDLIFIDGDHFYEGVKADITNAQQLLTPKGVILADDYGVEEGVADVDNGNLIDGHFGVKQAADELFDPAKWEECFTDISFANGGKAYRRKETQTHAPKAQSRKRR